MPPALVGEEVFQPDAEDQRDPQQGRQGRKTGLQFGEHGRRGHRTLPQFHQAQALAQTQRANLLSHLGGLKPFLDGPVDIKPSFSSVKENAEFYGSCRWPTMLCLTRQFIFIIVNLGGNRKLNCKFSRGPALRGCAALERATTAVPGRSVVPVARAGCGTVLESC